MPRNRIRSQILSWIDSNEFPWFLPWAQNLTDRERIIQRLRSYGHRERRLELIARQGWPRTLTQSLCWPALSLLKAWIAARDSPQAKISRRSRSREFLNIWWRLSYHQFRIADQYDTRVDLPANRKHIHGFIPCRELQMVHAAAHRKTKGNTDIIHKIGFARFCQQHGLPAPAVLASNENASAITPWPNRDLILKPSNLAKGKGIQLLRYDSIDGIWHTTDGTRITAHSLVSYCAKYYQGGPWLLQPRLINAPSWQPFTTGGLSTARIVVGRTSSSDEPIYIASFVRFPRGTSIVDNLSAGGVGATPVDAMGTLRAGSTWVGGAGAFLRHPDTGTQIEGARMPKWAELVALAIRAHHAAGAWSTMGWDVALTEEGPMLIEANYNWATMFNVPLSETPFVEIMQSLFGPHLEHLH